MTGRMTGRMVLYGQNGFARVPPNAVGTRCDGQNGFARYAVLPVILPVVNLLIFIANF